MSLIQIKQAVRSLSLGQLKRLDEWLHELIRKAEDVTQSEQIHSSKQVIEERTVENKTYRLERIRCGKEKCKCARGQLHGPYWYSYTRIKDKIKSQYIGKRPPNSKDKSDVQSMRK